jgi:hypothetical protein
VCVCVCEYDARLFKFDCKNFNLYNEKQFSQPIMTRLNNFCFIIISIQFDANLNVQILKTVYQLIHMLLAKTCFPDVGLICLQLIISQKVS